MTVIVGMAKQKDTKTKGELMEQDQDALEVRMIDFFFHFCFLRKTDKLSHKLLYYTSNNYQDLEVDSIDNLKKL